MSECLFCSIAKGEIPSDFVYQDEDIVAFKDINPQAPVHLLVIPRRHITSVLDTSDEDIALLGRLQSTAVKLAKEFDLDTNGFRLVINCLKDGGQAVFHLHLHLLGGRAMNWPPG
ncbi:MAG: histidine triad nucleotide-binding protein [Acidobacteriota bacterium]|nr:histidine triad nucleotide-binding protein [Acidobacteriota bacterium]